MRPGPIFCLLVGVSSDYVQPITGQVTEVNWCVIGWAICSANHRPGYWSNLACHWSTTVWAYSSEEETKTGPELDHQCVCRCPSIWSGQATSRHGADYNITHVFNKVGFGLFWMTFFSTRWYHSKWLMKSGKIWSYQYQLSELKSLRGKCDR